MLHTTVLTSAQLSHSLRSDLACFNHFQILMNVLLELTTVNNYVPTLQDSLPVDVTLDIGCWLMDTSAKVLICTL